MKVKLVDLIFCMFKGHQYSRFERRNPSCIHCNSIKKNKNQLESTNRRSPYKANSDMQQFEPTPTN